jgi:hypothetical protein
MNKWAPTPEIIKNEQDRITSILLDILTHYEELEQPEASAAIGLAITAIKKSNEQEA